MKDEPINPGYINQIFEISSKETCFNRSEFINATVKDKGLIFTYEVDILDEFIRLRIIIKYVQSAMETGVDLDVINFSRDFRVAKVHTIYAKDLLSVLQHCINIINQALLINTEQLKYLPKEFPIPVWESHQQLLENIANDLNMN